jgi:hypothetical protein
MRRQSLLIFFALFILAGLLTPNAFAESILGLENEQILSETSFTVESGKYYRFYRNILDDVCIGIKVTSSEYVEMHLQTLGEYQLTANIQFSMVFATESFPQDGVAAKEYDEVVQLPFGELWCLTIVNRGSNDAQINATVTTGDCIDIFLTTIELSVEETEISLGDSVNLFGLIHPFVDNKPVNVTFRRPDSSAIHVSTVTDVNGEFVLSFLPDVSGRWNVSASWEGDIHHIGATSNTCLIFVELLSTELSISLTDDTIFFGESITINGELIPNISNRSILITYTRPDNSIIQRAVKTSSQSSFNDTIISNMIGIWNVVASWDGDSLHYGTVSSDSPFEAKKILSSISSNINSTYVIKGDAILIWGSVEPKREAPITIKYKLSKNSDFLELVKTTSSSQGYYNHTFTPYLEEGLYNIKATVESDDIHSADTSPVVSLEFSKKIANISLSLSSDEILIGEEITIAGFFEPRDTQTIPTIIISYESESGRIQIHSEMLDSDYAFQDSYMPEVSGGWSIVVEWLGDDMFRSTSSSVSFTVQKETVDITIIIYDEEGNFGGGVEVSSISIPSQQTMLQGTSNQVGVVSFKDVQPGSYSFATRKSGYEDGTIDFNLNVGDEIEVNVYLEKKQAWIPGFPIVSLILGIIVGIQLLIVYARDQ